MLDQKRSIQSIEIGGQLLNVLARESRPMMLKDLAVAAGMTPSKAHPYLVSFGRLGLIEQNSLTGQYQLGSAALQLGLSCLSQLDPLRVATPIAEQLALDIEQSVAIAIWGNLGPTIVRMFESSQVIHVNMRTGTVMSTTDTATGKVFAAFMKKEKLQGLDAMALGDLALHGAKQNPALRQPSLKELEQIRRDNMAQANGRPIPGVNALSVPVFDFTGQMVLALTALGPEQTFSTDPGGKLALALRRAAALASQGLGYQPHIVQKNQSI